MAVQENQKIGSLVDMVHPRKEITEMLLAAGPEDTVLESVRKTPQSIREHGES